MNQENSNVKKTDKQPPRKREQPSLTSLLIIRQFARCYCPVSNLPLNEKLIILN